MEGENMLESLIRAGHLVDWLITAVFAVPTLWRFLEWAEHGFSWVLAAEIVAIVSVWLGLIAVIAVRDELKRQREQGGAEAPIVFFSCEPDKP